MDIPLVVLSGTWAKGMQYKPVFNIYGRISADYILD